MSGKQQRPGKCLLICLQPLTCTPNTRGARSGRAVAWYLGQGHKWRFCSGKNVCSEILGLVSQGQRPLLTSAQEVTMKLGSWKGHSRYTVKQYHPMSGQDRTGLTLPLMSSTVVGKARQRQCILMCSDGEQASLLLSFTSLKQA